METITLNRKEQQRVMVLNRVERRELTGAQAGELMGLSVRQVRRLVAGYRREGVVAIAHGNRGRRPPHAVGEAVRERVVALAAGRYDGANHTHLTELLAEREGLILSRSTVRRVLLSAGIKTPRRRRAPKHRRRRERYPQEGMMLQVDGSRHQWLQGRGPWLTLIGGIDDATGTVPYACFREQEDSYGYMLLLQGVIQGKGIPLTVYSDRHSIFMVSRAQHESLDEQLAGQSPRTQVGRALDELGVRLILANSPQAKGRIERLWGTFQDRLLTELRLAGARTLEEANAVLAEFLPRFNARFGVPAAQPGAAYRCVPVGTDLAGILCFKHQRTVAADNTVRFEGRTLQLLPNPHRASYARARVEVQQRLDGELIVTYQDRVILTEQAAPGTVSLRAHNQPQSNGSQDTGRDKAPAGALSLPRRPAPDHPWRRSFKTPTRTKISEPLG
jgi:transposase